MQYPEKLIANSWHIAAGQQHCAEEVAATEALEPVEEGAVQIAHRANTGDVYGFSGTKDNKDMMPLQVV